MQDTSITRREALKTGAAIGLTVLGATATTAAPSTQPSAATTRPAAPTIGIQTGPPPLARGDLDRLFDDLRSRGGVNALFPFIYTNTASTAAMPKEGFKGGNFAMPHMPFYKNTSLTFD